MKTILITGGTSRVGEKLASQFAAKGYNIVLHCHAQKEKAEAIKKTIQDAGGRCRLLVGDFLQKDLSASVKSIWATFGSLDGIIHAASLFGSDQTFTTLPNGEKVGKDATIEKYDVLQTLHARSLLVMCHALNELIQKEKKEASILCFLDQCISRPMKGYIAYWASKTTAASLVSALAVEYAPFMRVNGVALGMCAPTRHDNVDYTENYERLLISNPLRRPVDIDDVAHAASLVFENSSINGHITYIDNGEHIGTSNKALNACGL